jgi:hypothetical protein
LAMGTTSGTRPKAQTLLVATTERGLTRALMWLGAVLVLISGIEHLHLWDIAYRHVATLGPLFIVQGVVTIVLAIALAVGRRFILVVSGVALMAGTIVGFVLADTTGLFGFKLPSITNLAWFTLAVEIGAIVVLGIAGWQLWLEQQPRR